ncbi:unnamed protein product [Calypogeia fissa]
MHKKKIDRFENEEEEEDKKKSKKGRGSWLMRGDQKGSGPERKMGAITTAVIAVIGLLLGWAAVEVACKPCLESGRAAINRDLDPNYDPDDDLPGGSDSQSTQGPYNEAPSAPKLPKEV